MALDKMKKMIKELNEADMGKEIGGVVTAKTLPSEADVPPAYQI